jgi:hypothetical protein
MENYASPFDGLLTDYEIASNVPPPASPAQAPNVGPLPPWITVPTTPNMINAVQGEVASPIGQSVQSAAGAVFSNLSSSVWGAWQIAAPHNSGVMLIGGLFVLCGIVMIGFSTLESIADALTVPVKSAAKIAEVVS